MPETRQLFIDRRPFIWIWRPVYRYIYSPFYLRMYAPLMDRLSARQTALLAAETRLARQGIQQAISGHGDELRQEIRVAQHEIRIARQETQQHVSAELRAAQEEARKQWAATEHLLLNSLLNTSSDSARHEAAAVNRLLLEQIFACGREVDRMAERLATMESEMDRRWNAMEQLLLTALGSPASQTQSLSSASWPLAHSAAASQPMERAGH